MWFSRLMLGLKVKITSDSVVLAEVLESILLDEIKAMAAFQEEMLYIVQSRFQNRRNTSNIH